MKKFIDPTQLKEDGWRLTRIVAHDGEFKPEYMPLDEVESIDPFQVLVDYAASLGQSVSIVFNKTVEEIKAEAINDFVERLKYEQIDCDISFGYGKEVYTSAVAMAVIEEIAERMMEDTDNA